MTELTDRPAAERPPQPVNVRVEVTISDQRGNAPAVKKTITAVTGDGMNARVRTNAHFTVDLGAIPLNLDAMPTILPGGRIRVAVGLQYEMPVIAEGAPPSSGTRLMKTTIQENLAVNLDDGRPLVVAQSADPISDRQVTVEVRATILK